MLPATWDQRIQNLDEKHYLSQNGELMGSITP